MILMMISNGILLLIIIMLIVIKTLHFLKHIRHKKFTNWIYFNRYSIIMSSTEESAAAKRKQNAYSFRIGMTLLLMVLTVYAEVLLLL